MRTTEENKILSELLFPDITELPIDIFKKYPDRKLAKGAMVLRFAPSPTGFLHIGGIFTGLVGKSLSKQSNGIFILRIEDTDKRREIENGIAKILDGFRNFKIEFDEGVLTPETFKGEYGPYIQSQRLNIYKVFAKYLVSKGFAYPCFMTENELKDIREKQKKNNLRTGCYGKWALWRDRNLEDIQSMLSDNKKFVIRLYSTGNIKNTFNITDFVKGRVTLRENDMDAVLLKSDGYPTYHFAHPIDDILMGITLITRGDEWFSSVPLHIELFQKLNFKQIPYAHFPPLMKLENSSKRKLSKRKDPEADVNFYIEKGYPVEGVKEYLFNIANSNFYDWRLQNKSKLIEEFNISLNKFNKSGALFDIVKLEDTCKDYIASLSAEQIYIQALAWSEIYNQKLKNLLKKNKELCIKILNIERKGSKVRKDIVEYSDIEEQLSIFFEEIFKEIEYEDISEKIEKEIQKNILQRYLQVFDISENVNLWFEGVRKLAEELKLKAGDVAMVLRVAITKKTKSPDLYQIISVLGKEEVIERLEKYKEFL